MRALATLLQRYLLGALFTLTPVTAVLVVGWTQRATARSVAFREHGKRTPWPRWIMADDAGDLFRKARSAGPLSSVGFTLRALFGSLWLNAKLGVRALIPIAIVALPAGLLFLFSWWAGWDNSFNKGYEQSAVGPAIALAGIVYFIIVMTILPLAEVRHAVHNSWTAFFDIPFLRRAAREVKLGLIGLGLAFVAAGLIIATLKVIPLGIGNAAETPADAEGFAHAYVLLVAAVLFPLYVALRLAAARVYTRATARLAAKGETNRAGLTKIVVGSGTLLSGALASTVMFAVWFGLVAEIYVSQFLVHDWMHWINHPLIQLPWTGSIFWPP
jgi:hypothetical protein